MKIRNKWAKWLIRLAYVLDPWQVNRCSIGDMKISVDIKSVVPDDGQWHEVRATFNAWMQAGAPTQTQQSVYVDGATVLADQIEVKPWDQ